MDTIEQMKREADTLPVGRGAWRENDARLIWCGRDGTGGYAFHNTTSPIKHGPKISEAEAERYLASEGPWTRSEPRAA